MSEKYTQDQIDRFAPKNEQPRFIVKDDDGKDMYMTFEEAQRWKALNKALSEAKD